MTAAIIPEESISFPLVRSPVVYFLMLGDECVYVGATKRLGLRIHNHATGTGTPKKEFDSVRYIHVEPHALWETENFWINELQPSGNIQGKRRKPTKKITMIVKRHFRDALRQLSKTSGLNMGEIIETVMVDSASELRVEFRKTLDAIRQLSTTPQS